jgi:vancomycin resistance protein YoaR
MLQKITRHIILFLFFLIFTLALFLIAFEVAYAYKIYPYASVANIEVSGKTKSEAVEILIKKTDAVVSKGLDFAYQDKKVNITSTLIGLNSGDFFGEIFSYDVNQTVNNVYNKGHLGDWLTRSKEQLDNILKKDQSEFVINLDTAKLKTVLKENFADLQETAVDASVDVITKGSNITIKIKPEKAGMTFDYDTAIDQAIQNLKNLEQMVINLEIIADQPKISSGDIEKVVPQIEEIIKLAPVVLNYNDKKWEISKKELALWLKAEKKDQEIGVIINKEIATKFLDQINNEVKIDALDAKFEIKDNKVSLFQTSQEGQSLNIEKTIAEIEAKFILEKNNNIQIVVEKTEPEIKNNDTNILGVVEMLGQGVSDFKGSPQNRIHNIKTGASKLNGILIKPEEVFSLIKTLGDIDGKNGYKQELVIKGNKTTPEYGGGLCQIGTTLFRSILQSGLPILDRRSHSYNVSYYAPTGTDATIYNPAPDFKFQNDTGKHLLILTRVEGVKVIFEIWGTKDGRSVEFVGKERVENVKDLVPVVFNVIKPGAVKYIETDTLEPGKKKKLESSHTGADATFDYIINYPSGEKKEKTFKSHYVPWREVWLIGVEKLKEAEVVGEIKTETPTTSL